MNTITKSEDLQSFQHGEISEQLLKDATSQIYDFSIAFELEGEPAGSGTLIQYRDLFGVLTAHHVPHNPFSRSRRFDFSSSHQKLGLVLHGQSHFFEIPMNTMGVLDIGIPKSAEEGPDLAVIVLPNSEIGRISSHKSFFNLSIADQNRLDSALSDLGFFMITGYPQELMKEVPRDRHFREIVQYTGIASVPENPKRFEKYGFDYLDIVASISNDGNHPHSYRGLSGGGIWRIDLTRRKSEDNSKLRINEIILAGIAFYETPISGNERTLRCHGGKSIYRVAASRIEKFIQTRNC